MFPIQRHLIAAFVSVATAGPALADGRFTVWGVGNDSCGMFVQEYATDSDRYRMEISWIAGFVSAKNGDVALIVLDNAGRSNVGKKGYDILKEADPSAFIAFVNNYCSSHPLENLNTAAIELSTALMKKVSNGLSR